MIERFLRETIAQTNTNTGSKVQVNPIRYISNPPDSGWLWVKIEDPNGVQRAINIQNKGQKLVICENTKVQITQVKDGRTHFKILDHISKGVTASLSNENSEKHLSKLGPKLSSNGAELEIRYSSEPEDVWSEARRQNLSQVKGKLIFNAIAVDITVSTLPNDYTILTNGTHNILLPDFPHDANMTQFYRTENPDLKYDQVWFPIAMSDRNNISDRYIHVGAVSHGCMTVYDLEKWNKLYKYLINNRQSDNMQYVGKLHIRNLD